MAGFFKSHRDYYLYVFSLLLLYIELLVYGHSVQTLFWLPETIEVFGCVGESDTEDFTQVGQYCGRIYPGSA